MKRYSKLLYLSIIFLTIAACQKNYTEYEELSQVEEVQPSSTFQHQNNDTILENFKTFLNVNNIEGSLYGTPNWSCYLIDKYSFNAVRISIPFLDASGNIKNALIGVKVGNEDWKYRFINKNYYLWRYQNTSFGTNRYYYVSLLSTINRLESQVNNSCAQVEADYIENRCQDWILCGPGVNIIIDCQTGAMIIYETPSCPTGGSGGGYSVSVVWEGGTVIWDSSSGDDTNPWSGGNWNPDEDTGIIFSDGDGENDTNIGGGGGQESFSVFCKGLGMTQLADFDQTIEKLEYFITSNNLLGFTPWDLVNLLQPSCKGSSENFIDCLLNSILCEIDSKVDLSEQELQVLSLDPTRIIHIFSFLDKQSNSEEAREYVKVIAQLLLDDSEYKVTRLVELFEKIQLDADFLVADCFTGQSNFNLDFWSELASFTPGQMVMDKINSLSGNYSVQELENAVGARVNLDYFGVNIQQMPNKPNGTRYSDVELIEHFRKNINHFHSQSGTSFDPITQDTGLWNSMNPLTSVISISIAEDDGSVICSDFQPCCWVFTTLGAPGWLPGIWSPSNDGYHPVSGNRQFGISDSDQGKLIYTKGVDRVTKWYHNLFENSAFSGADFLWTSMEGELDSFINNNGGQATRFPVSQERFYRPNWEDVKNKLKSNNPINHISCF